jgi:hypothetical protein
MNVWNSIGFWALILLVILGCLPFLVELFMLLSYVLGEVIGLDNMRRCTLPPRYGGSSLLGWRIRRRTAEELLQTGLPPNTFVFVTVWDKYLSIPSRVSEQLSSLDDLRHCFSAHSAIRPRFYRGTYPLSR